MHNKIRGEARGVRVGEERKIRCKCSGGMAYVGELLVCYTLVKPKTSGSIHDV